MVELDDVEKASLQVKSPSGKKLDLSNYLVSSLKWVELQESQKGSPARNRVREEYLGFRPIMKILVISGRAG